jgi:hypothetical protein
VEKQWGYALPKYIFGLSAAKTGLLCGLEKPKHGVFL